jgi:hypothetical protein
MPLTNKHNIPVRWQKLLDPQLRQKNPEAIGVTDLVGPPRIRELNRRHFDEVEQDVSDFSAAFSGKAFHHFASHVLRNHNAMSEEMLEIEVAGMKVKGVPDLYEYETKHLVDFKEVSAWALVFSPNGKPEEIWQVNCYAAMLRIHGHEVRSASLDRKIKDWKKSEMMRSPDYPRIAMPHIVPVPLKPHDEVMAYMAQRVRLHREAQKPDDAALPECTTEERWEKAGVWAVHTAGRKSALKLCDTEDAAKGYAASVSGAFVKYRPGERTRCEGYCPVAPWCSTFKNFKQQQQQEAA